MEIIKSKFGGLHSQQQLINSNRNLPYESLLCQQYHDVDATEMGWKSISHTLRVVHVDVCDRNKELFDRTYHS